MCIQGFEAGASLNHLHCPVLALDLGSRISRGLLYTPQPASSEKDKAALYSFTLPSSGQILGARIRHCTQLGLCVYIHCPDAISDCAQALRDHLAAGCALHLHPKTAAILGLQQKQLEAMGIQPAHSCPALAESLWDADSSIRLWRSLPAMLGLPEPQAILVSALEYEAVFPPECEAGTRGSRVRPGNLLWSMSRDGAMDIHALMAKAPDEGMLRLHAIQRITGYPAIDSSAACLLGLLAAPGISGRSYREGVTLLFAGRNIVSAGLVFQNRLWGFLELPAKRVLPSDGSEPSLLLNCLEDFRLGWLPKERAAQLGGFVDSAPELPSEAEGFRPLFMTGSGVCALKDKGQLAGNFEDMAMNNCRGLLYGYARLCEEIR